MFSKFNYLTISILVLGSLLILSILVLIVYRFLTRKKVTNAKNNQIGKVNHHFNDLIKLLALTTDYQIIYNVLIKNKYAKKNYSLIPAIIFCQNNLFLVSNLINLTKVNEVTFSANNEYFLINKKNKQKSNNELDLGFFKEVKKYLMHNFKVNDVHFVIPCLQGASKINNQSKNQIIDVFNFAEHLDHLSTDQKAIDLMTIKKISQKLTTANLFKAKISITNNYHKKGISASV